MCVGNYNHRQLPLDWTIRDTKENLAGGYHRVVQKNETC